MTAIVTLHHQQPDGTWAEVWTGPKGEARRVIEEYRDKGNKGSFEIRNAKGGLVGASYGVQW